MLQSVLKCYQISQIYFDVLTKALNSITMLTVAPMFTEFVHAFYVFCHVYKFNCRHFNRLNMK